MGGEVRELPLVAASCGGSKVGGAALSILQMISYIRLPTGAVELPGRTGTRPHPLPPADRRGPRTYRPRAENPPRRASEAPSLPLE